VPVVQVQELCALRWSCVNNSQRLLAHDEECDAKSRCGAARKGSGELEYRTFGCAHCPRQEHAFEPRSTRFRPSTRSFDARSRSCDARARAGSASRRASLGAPSHQLSSDQLRRVRSDGTSACRERQQRRAPPSVRLRV
jgi:hypothetical protein